MGYEKNLGNIYEIIVENLQNKYSALKKEENIKEVFDNRLVFIDDIENNLNDYPNKQITCPEYTYKPVYTNFKEKLMKKYGISEEVFEDKELLKYCYNNDIPIYNKNSEYLLQNDKLLYNLLDSYYLRLSELKIKQQSTDEFFKILIKKLKNINTFNEKNLQKINIKDK
jgi:hypothetical protein